MAIPQDVLTRADALRRGTNISLTDAITISQRLGSAVPIDIGRNIGGILGGTTGGTVSGGTVSGGSSPGRPAIPPPSTADPGASPLLLIPNVLPGDLITARLTNVIINRLNDVYVQLLRLDSATTSNNEIVITSLEPPSGSVKVGDLLTVNGRNFGVSTGLMRLFVDDTPITGLQSSSDQQIVFRIPLTFTDVPSNGRPAVLTITNQNTSAQRTLLLQPAMTLAGVVDVNARGVQPATPMSNTPATFEFQLISQANLDATYTISASVVPNLGGNTTRAASWQSVHILDSDQATEVQQVHLAPNQQKTIYVRISPIPPLSDGVSFDVSLTLRSTTGNAGGSSGAHTYTVGTPADVPDPTITLNAPSVEVISGVASADATTITLGAGGGGNFTYPATFSVAGFYDIDAVLGNGATNLDVFVMNPPTSPLASHGTLQILDSELRNPQGKAPKNLTIALGRKAGSTPGNITLKVTRQRQTQFVTKTMQLRLS